MAWDDPSKDKRKNPWGRNSTPPGGDGSSGPGGPDLDEMLRRAQENFRFSMPDNFRGGKIALGVLGAVLLLWMASGFYTVSPGEHAVIQRFGAWDRTQILEGLNYHLPAPFESRIIVNVNEIRRLTIGYGEEPQRRGAQRQDFPEESLMLTADRNIIDLDLVIQWNIKSAEDFLFNIRDQEATIKKVAESAIREVVGQTNMFPIITTERGTVAQRTREILQRNLDEYRSGVNITQVLIEKAEVHPDVQGGFQDVQSAKQEAESYQNEAEEYREGILPRARGQAVQLIEEARAYEQSAIARAKGDADRFNSIYESYLTGKDVTRQRIFIETMEDVLKNASKIIVDDSAGQGVVPYLPLNELTRKTAGE